MRITFQTGNTSCEVFFGRNCRSFAIHFKMTGSIQRIFLGNLLHAFVNIQLIFLSLSGYFNKELKTPASPEYLDRIF